MVDAAYQFYSFNLQRQGRGMFRLQFLKNTLKFGDRLSRPATEHINYDLTITRNMNE